MLVEILLKKNDLDILIFLRGSLRVLIISFLVSMLFLPFSKKYFFYEFKDKFFIKKYFFKEIKFFLVDIKNVEFSKYSFKIFLIDGTVHIEKNRMNYTSYKRFQEHFRKLINHAN